MASAQWKKAKGRSAAKAWLRHNDKGHRADKAVTHENPDIQPELSHLNFEVGATAGLTLKEKCARLDAVLDKYGFDDATGKGTVNERVAMVSRCAYPPKALVEAARDPETGKCYVHAPGSTPSAELLAAEARLAEWFEAFAKLCEDEDGEEAVIAAYVDVDEQHEYIDENGLTVMSAPHLHLYEAPVCEGPVELPREVVFETVRDADGATVWAKNDDGMPKLDELRRPVPEYVLDGDGNRVPERGRDGKIKRRRVFEERVVYDTMKDADGNEVPKLDAEGKPAPKLYRSGKKRGQVVTERVTERHLKGRDFCDRSRIVRLNNAAHEMTKERFKCDWNEHEPGTYERQKGRAGKTNEQLKKDSLARLDAKELARAEAEISANVAASEATLYDAQAVLWDAQAAAHESAVESVLEDEIARGLVTRETRHAKAEAEAAKTEAKVAKAEAATAKREAAEAVRERDAYAGESYRTKDGRTVLGTKGLKAENERLRAEGERIAEANAGRSAALDERERALRAGEDKLAEDRAEVSRLLDGDDRTATVEDYLPAEYHATNDFYLRNSLRYTAEITLQNETMANGGEPPIIHAPGLRETVKRAEEARQGYEAAAEEARRERDALRDFREDMVHLLEGLCGSVKRRQMDNDRKGRKATATFFKAVHGMFVEVLKTLDDAHVPEAPTLDRAAWDDALSAAEAEQARADQRTRVIAAARVPAPGIPRETPGWGTPRTPKPSGWDGPSM
ncbi:hypothetical protein E0L17_01380 [Olsenella sp. SW781]|uniref:hypothetical protein n=1 Tax=Olsenella sp. SW781 TaxID=2530046 RepID=UPI00143B2813|nr:hypothetical protein [Olsenella sp. SW781]NJE79990.1 hypothetical protein [Olsenella sp. SW781]